MFRPTRRELLWMGLALGGGLALEPLTGCVSQAKPATATPSRSPLITPTPALEDLPWPEARAIVDATIVPRFPDRFFDVTAAPYLARADTGADSTQAFQRAIADCSSSGGGHVIVPTGVYSLGAVHLRDGVDLHLEQGAELMFSGNVADFPLVLTRYGGIECMNHSPMVYAFGQTNIALTGDGVLDASNTRSWNVGEDRAGVLAPLVAAGLPPQQRIVPAHGGLRSSFVEPYRCRNVLIQGITLRQSQFWQVHPTLCRNVTIDSVTTGDTANHNTDACDVDCCYNVVVKHCAFDGADDSIAIKSGLDDDGRRVNTPSQNIVIYRCRVQGVGAAVACGSDTTGGIRNVYAFGVETFGRSTLYMLNVKSNTHRGGYVRNVNLDSCRGDSLGGPWLFAEMNYQDHEYLSASYPPKFEDWTVSNASGDSDPVILVFTGLPGDEIRNVVVTDSNFTNIRSPHNVYEHVTGVVLRNVTINGVPASS